jgi:uncharacterized protein
VARSVAVITGASSGIGAMFARKLAARHELLLIARREDRLKMLAAELISQHGSVVDVLVADLNNETDLTLVAERIAGETDLALLVNSAGFGVRGLFWEADLEVQQRMHRLHITATLRLTHAALRNLVARNSGGIINVASIAAFMRRTGGVGYGATKAWMTAFTEGLYLDLKSSQSAVKVQALCPGFTKTAFHETITVKRHKLAPSFLSLTAEDVVEESLKGFACGKLFVVPGWHYKALVSLISKLPTPLRLALEAFDS